MLLQPGNRTMYRQFEQKQTLHAITNNNKTLSDYKKINQQTTTLMDLSLKKTKQNKYAAQWVKL